jgi:tryptophanyl-tRNA synthetase
MKPLIVSAHNPMTGARHLGHYLSTMSDWLRLERDHEIFVIIDDIIASLLYPSIQSELGARSLQVAREFIATGVDLENTSIALTSMLPEAHEMYIFASAHMDNSLCQDLYRESFPALLGSYQRKQLGLPHQPSVAEINYPQIHLAALTLGVRADFFQGGEEMKGYAVPLEALSQTLRIPEPKFLPGQSTLVLGTDGQHMASDNALFISAPEDEISESILSIRNSSILQSWCHALGMEEIANQLKVGREPAQLREIGQRASKSFAAHFSKFREYSTDPQFVGAILEKGSAKIRARLSATLTNIKHERSFAGYYK